MNGSEKMKLVKGIYRDVKAIELNDLLTKFIGKLEETCIGYEEELMNITLIEVERREKDFDELIQNPDEFHKVIDLILIKTFLTNVLGFTETEIEKNKDEINKAIADYKEDFYKYNWRRSLILLGYSSGFKNWTRTNEWI